MAALIAVNPNVHFGKPCIAGTRIKVEDVMELIEEGIPFSEIIKDHYPDLTLDDLRACVRFARNLLAAEEIHVAAQSA
ncbi:MAG: DUF433 domain-containing protein [Planctomycetota bacterium]|nr:DUF433 domain-containing protein [Planctomycetota bacterium]